MTGRAQWRVYSIILIIFILIITILRPQSMVIENSRKTIAVLLPEVQEATSAECLRLRNWSSRGNHSAINSTSQQHCINNFMSEYARYCRLYMVPKVRGIHVEVNGIRKYLQLCPCIPRVLCGFNDVIDHVSSIEFKDDGGSLLTGDESSTGGVSDIGGRWRPNWCLPRQRIAIIVPFRNREGHLRMFLRHMRSFLRRQLLEFTIFVIEQLDQGTFNRGSLINAGFLEAKSRDEFDCYFLHDVDMLPLDDRDFYTCSSSPRHVAGHQKNHQYRPAYDCYFGGVQAFTSEHFTQVNGYSNMFYGWGGEDDDLLHRVWAQNITVAERRTMCISRFGMKSHERDAGNEVGEHKRFAELWRPYYYPLDGLNTVQYKVIKLDERAWYTRVGVTLPKFDPNSTATQLFERDFDTTPKIIGRCTLQKRLSHVRRRVK